MDGRGRMVAPGHRLAAVHLVALSFFAIAWPLLDLLGRNPEFFVVRGSRATDIALLATGLTLGPPALLLALEELAGLVSPRLRTWAHVAFVGVLAGAFALLLLGWAGAPPAAAVAALAAGALAAWAYGRFEALRSVVSMLAIAVPVFLGLFLFGSASGDLVVGGSDAEVASVEVRRPAPIVMVVFDEFPVGSLLGPNGEIDAGRYPAFAGLARESTWYRNAVTVSASTSYAVPALLTGRNEGGAATLADHPRNLFTLLGGTYRIEAAEAVTRLCPDRLCPRGSAEPLHDRLRSLADDLGVVYGHELLPEPLRARLPSISGVWGDFGNDDARPAGNRLGANFVLRNLLPGSVAGREAAFETFIRAVRPTERPTLWFLHVLLPHYPWEHTPSGRVYDGLTIPGLTRDFWTGTEFQARQAWQRHLAQVGYTDRLVGRLVERLRATSLWDEALVVFVADHGTSFRAGQPRKVVSASTIEDQAFVPLFVKAPGQARGRTVEETVSTLDIVPTIADHLGVGLPWPVEGVSRAAGGGRAVETVRMPGGDGPLAVPADDLRRRLDARLALQARLFGRSWDELYRFGAAPTLVGDPTPEGVSGAEATLDPQSWRANEARVPAFVRGTVTGRASAVAIVVNGRVAAVVPATDTADGRRFSAFLSEDAFRRGENDVRAVPVNPGG